MTMNGNNVSHSGSLAQARRRPPTRQSHAHLQQNLSRSEGRCRFFCLPLAPSSLGVFILLDFLKPGPLRQHFIAFALFLADI